MTSMYSLWKLFIVFVIYTFFFFAYFLSGVFSCCVFFSLFCLGLSFSPSFSSVCPFVRVFFLVFYLSCFKPDVTLIYQALLSVSLFVFFFLTVFSIVSFLLYLVDFDVFNFIFSFFLSFFVSWSYR